MYPFPFLLHLFALALSFTSPASAIKNTRIVGAYLPFWDGVEAKYVDFTRITHLFYAFAYISPNGTITPPLPNDPILATFASQTHAGNALAMLSIGGWGLEPFSTAFSTPVGIATFVTSVHQFVHRYGFDGVDIDWEYPGEPGACGNPWSPSDTDNFLVAMKALRHTMGPTFLLSATTPVYPWLDSTGHPMSSATSFAHYFDFLSIMSYDLNGIWGTVTGANAPLIQDARNLGTPGANVVSAVEAWMNAGVPAHKIVLGVAFYGHYMKAIHPMTHNPPSEIYVPVQHGSTGHSCLGAGLGGDFTYTQIVRLLTTPGWIHHYDPHTQTPWLFNMEDNTFISYDDARSVSVKAAWAGCMGLGGVMMWEVTNDGGALLPALSSFMDVPVGTPGLDCLHYAITTKTVLGPAPVPVGPTPTDPTARCGTSFQNANENCFAFCRGDDWCEVGQTCQVGLTKGLVGCLSPAVAVEI
ncbi:hypothetical protein HDU98_000770 [Podochytrium sp. JEL0797]|nr:hypothetical protein HDU98_000770 [Podochytrium sp. JEL0797]